MEIEIRAFIKNFSSIKAKLKKLRCKRLSKTSIIDIWFCKQEAKSFNEIKMDSVGSTGIRIRKENGKLAELNVKTITRVNDHNVFEELQTDFKNIEEMKKILGRLGYKPFCVIKKKREIFQFDEMKINLEDIKGFPPCLEVEIIAEKEYNSKLDKIKKLLLDLGISEKDQIEKSITALYMEKYAFKTEKESQN
ncbi:CYTH domain-containing protein [Candidatus Woesearchaeota archaeon]|nr:CYTH domain-containing protein [Candidatus Woesearchaeota archaeon]